MHINKTHTSFVDEMLSKTIHYQYDQKVKETQEKKQKLVNL